MFKGMPKIFWIGMGILYGWIFTFIILEMHIPGLPLMKFMGVPACYIYNAVIALWLINVFVAYLFYVFEEKREIKLEAKKKARESLAAGNIPDDVKAGFNKLLDII
ncbi:MAG: hypothetical protein HQK74_04375 [Desulfamplus sp.]|nr:hypothetical protein [Desulfamplus sp.]